MASLHIGIPPLVRIEKLKLRKGRADEAGAPSPTRISTQPPKVP